MSRILTFIVRLIREIIRDYFQFFPTKVDFSLGGETEAEEVVEEETEAEDEEESDNNDSDDKQACECFTKAYKTFVQRVLAQNPGIDCDCEPGCEEEKSCECFEDGLKVFLQFFKND